MLKGISPLLGPDLLNVLYRMGHGDEIILADAHFPGERYNELVLRADGIRIDDLLEAILPLFELDAYTDHPVMMMAPVEGDMADPDVEKRYLKCIRKFYPGTTSIERLERFEFYERTEDAFAVVITGETSKYGNILLKKGVTPC